MEWTYNGKTEFEIPQKSIGFIYLITNTVTGKFYIGRKLLQKKTTKTVGGKKKSVHVESDWKDYYSSSPELKSQVKELGKDKFKREILSFCPTKGSMLYCEEMCIYMSGALESDMFINNNIRSKVYRSWIQGKMDTTELRQKIQSLSSSSIKSSSSSEISSPQSGQ
jgi:hypothetical protein